MRILLAVLALLCCASVFAQNVTGTGTATLTWTPPTQYTNGDPTDVELAEVKARREELSSRIRSADLGGEGTEVPA